MTTGQQTWRGLGIDFATYRAATGQAIITFDFYNGGFVNAIEFAQFRARFGTSISVFVSPGHRRGGREPSRRAFGRLFGLSRLCKSIPAAGRDARLYRGKNQLS